MVDNPYINKQNWGRDLLDRLNNFSEDDGSFNVWEELPTTGKDGQTLDISHTGLTGILQQNETSIQRWNGESWDILAKIPLSIQGSLEQVNSVSIESTFVAVLNPSVSSNFFYVFKNTNTGTITLEKYSKSTGAIAWSSARNLESGFNYGFTGGNSTGRYPFVEDSVNIYIGVQSWTSITNSASVRNEVYAFSKETGTYLWKTLIDTSTSTLLIGLTTANNNLFVLQTFTSKIAVINTANGTLISNATLGFSNVIDFGTIFYNSIDNNLIVAQIPVNTARLEIYVVNIAATSVVSTYSSASSSTDNVFIVSFWSNPAESNKILFIDYKSSVANDRLLSYNASTNTASQLFTIPQSQRDVAPIFGIKFEGNITTLYTTGASFSSGASIREAKINTTQATFEKMAAGFFPSGGGILVLPRDRVLTTSSIKTIKQSSQSLGYGSNTLNRVTLSLSGLNQQITSFLNAVITAKSNTSSIRSENTFANVYCDSLTTPMITVNGSIAVPNATSGASAILSSPTPDSGILIGSWGRLFSTNAIPGIHSDSGTYTGGKVYTSGMLFNSELIAGRVVNINPAAGGNGLIIYDSGIGKFFIQSRPGGGTRDTLTNFPGGSGFAAIVVDPSNNVGIKTESPAFALDVNGEMRATVVRNSGGVITSDPFLKINMLSLPGNDLWEACQQLNPITFLYKPDFKVKITEIQKDENGNDIVAEIDQKWQLPQGIQYGYNAAEVELLFPELVSEDPQGIKYLNSGALFPIFQSAAVAKINSLEAKIEFLESAIASLITRIEVLENA